MSRLQFEDGDALADLATFIGRAKRVDPDGAARLTGHGEVLTVTVCPLPGVGGFDVMGLRAWRLATPATIDVTVSLAAITDRLARSSEVGATLDVPPVPVLGAAWSGVGPPRAGWQPAGAVTTESLRTIATEGIAEVAGATGLPPVAAAAKRNQVWGADLGSGLPAGVAFVAEVLGFLGSSSLGVGDDIGDGDGETESLAIARNGSWLRVTTSRGHVLARRGLF